MARVICVSFIVSHRC